MVRTCVDYDQAAQFSSDPELFKDLDESNVVLLQIVVFLSRDCDRYSLPQPVRLQAQPKMSGVS